MGDDDRQRFIDQAAIAIAVMLELPTSGPRAVSACFDGAEMLADERAKRYPSAAEGSVTGGVFITRNEVKALREAIGDVNVWLARKVHVQLVVTMRKHGFSDTEVGAALRKLGFSDTEVDAAFRQLADDRA